MSDLVINVRQIASYPLAEGADPTDVVLIQGGGLGGPYASINPLGLLAPLANASLGIGWDIPGDVDAGFLFTSPVLANGFAISWNNYNGPMSEPIYWQQGTASLFNSGPNGFSWAMAPSGSPGQVVQGWQDLMVLTNPGMLYLFRGTLQVARDPAAAMEVATMGWVGANTVASFNGRTGMVSLWAADIYAALCYTSPIATEQSVCDAINAFLLNQPLVTSFNGRDGAVVLNSDDITLACTAPLAIAQTNLPPPTDASLRIANTLWVSNYLYGPYWQEILTAIAGGGAGGPWAPINSPAFTGTPTTTPPPAADNSSRIPTTNWVRIALSSYAPLISPSFSGLPAAPTANPGTSTAQIATTAFVMAAVASATTGVISWNGRTGAVEFTQADLNDVGGALINSPNFTGIPQVPMAPAGIGTAQIASTAWVLDEISAISSGVISWNGRSGIVDFQASDLTAVGGALLASPAFTGVPTAPTASANTSTTQIATTAFVMGSLTNTVSTFNGRNGAVVLNANDITAAGGLANPSVGLTGTPTAPTAAPGTNTTQIATTAFVTAALANVGSGYLPTTGGTMTGPIQLANGTAAAPGLVSGTAGYVQFSGVVLGNGTPTANTLNIGGSVNIGNTGGLTVASLITANGGINSSGNINITGGAGLSVGSGGIITTGNTQTGTLGVTGNVSVGGVLQTNGNDGTYFAAGVITNSGNLLVSQPSNVDAKLILGNPGVTWQVGASGGNQNFYIWQGGSTGSTRMSIDPSGNVTWSIATMLVSGAAGGGNVNISGAASVGNQLTVSGWCAINGANSSGLGLIITNGVPLIQRTDTNNVTMEWGNAISTWQIYKAGNADQFGIWQGGLGGGGANRMLIDSAGQVTFSSFLTIGSTFYCYHIQPQNNGVVNCGQVSWAWSNVYSYNYPAPSHPSLKREISVPPQGALEAVMACPTVQFKWNIPGQDQNRLHRGFLTTDVEEHVHADLVVKDPEGKGPDCLHVNELIAVLWQAVQELTAKVTRLEGAAA